MWSELTSRMRSWTRIWPDWAAADRGTSDLTNTPPISSEVEHTSLRQRRRRKSLCSAPHLLTIRHIATHHRRWLLCMRSHSALRAHSLALHRLPGTLCSRSSRPSVRPINVGAAKNQITLHRTSLLKVVRYETALELRYDWRAVVCKGFAGDQRARRSSVSSADLTLNRQFSASQTQPAKQ